MIDKDFVWAHTCHRVAEPVRFMPWPRLVCSSCNPKWWAAGPDIMVPRSEFEAERARVERLWNEEMTSDERAEARRKAEEEHRLTLADIWTRRKAGLDLPS